MPLSLKLWNVCLFSTGASVFLCLIFNLSQLTTQALRRLSIAAETAFSATKALLLWGVVPTLLLWMEVFYSYGKQERVNRQDFSKPLVCCSHTFSFRVADETSLLGRDHIISAIHVRLYLIYCCKTQHVMLGCIWSSWYLSCCICPRRWWSDYHYGLAEWGRNENYLWLFGTHQIL